MENGKKLELLEVTKMIIGIIAAMDKEVKLIKESLTNYQKSVIAGVKF